MTRCSLYGRTSDVGCFPVLPTRRVWLTERVWRNSGSSSRWKMTLRRKKSYRLIRRMPASVYNIRWEIVSLDQVMNENTWRIEYRLKQKLVHRITEGGNKPKIILDFNGWIRNLPSDTWAGMQYKLGWAPVQNEQSKRTLGKGGRERSNNQDSERCIYLMNWYNKEHGQILQRLRLHG